MEHPFFTATTTRAEALRWLTISEKLLSARDLMGSKSFAMRARDSDPTLSPADEILAVVDTLLAGDRRIGNNQQDWYAILRLTPQQGRDAELIANQYRTLVLNLNPQKNKFPFAEQAFRLVVDAWSVLSNPSRKSLYDKEIAFYSQAQQQQQQQQQQQLQPDPFSDQMPTLQQNFMFFGGGGSSSGGGGVSHYPQVQQVHAQPIVEPVVSGSTRVPQNFMNFNTGNNLLFGSGSGSMSGHEGFSNQAHQSYSTFASNVSPPTSGATQEQVSNNNKQKQPEPNYFNVGDKANHNVNASANVGDKANHNVNASANVGEVVDDVDTMHTQEERVDAPANNDGQSTFWTACPYCYYMYEYPGEYADCTLRCQNCKSAFQGVVVSSPPPSMEGQEGYFCCWGFLPLGFSMANWEKNRSAAPAWTPFSPMFTCPRMENSEKRKVGRRKSSTPRVYVDDDEVFVEISGSSESDGDWQAAKENKKQNKTRNVKGKGSTGTPNKSAKKTRVDKGKNATTEHGIESPSVVEVTNKTIVGQVKTGAATGNGRKQPGRVAKNFGKLDLNVEFSNEAEEPALRVHQGNGPGRREDENIEGIGFFEGLDEFLSSLPILNVVGDDKVVKAA